MGSGRPPDMTSRPTTDEPVRVGVDEGEVADFLRTHPDFFERHLALLTELVVPHSTRGGAVSLLERQLAALRDQLGAERGRLKSLMNAARENSRLQQRLQRCFEITARVDDLDDLLSTLPAALQTEFGLESVLIRFLDSAVVPVDSLVTSTDETVQTLIQRLQGKRCLVEAPPSLEIAHQLSPDRASRVASCAVLPVRSADEALIGWVILAARDPQRYRPDMDTVLLEGLAGLVGAACSRMGLA